MHAGRVVTADGADQAQLLPGRRLQGELGLLAEAFARAGLDFPLLAQGEGSRSELLERFAAMLGDEIRRIGTAGQGDDPQVNLGADEQFQYRVSSPTTGFITIQHQDHTINEPLQNLDVTLTQCGAEHVTVHASADSVAVYERSGFRPSPRLLFIDAAITER